MDKLLFFNENAIRILQNDLTDLIHNVKSGQLNFRKAHQQLQDAQTDNLNIFWAMAMQIQNAKNVLRTLMQYQKIRHIKPAQAVDMVNDDMATMKTLDYYKNRYRKAKTGETKAKILNGTMNLPYEDQQKFTRWVVENEMFNQYLRQ
jgi:hypothetical protein